MTKTEEFRENLILSIMDYKHYDRAPAEWIVNKAILPICKEAGLKFTRTGVRGDDLEGACVCQVEEIDVITYR